MDYDFSTLSPHDFELLTQDLLQREYGVALEGFKTGRDYGIDLRRCDNRQLGLVIQCKHFVRSTFGKLKTALTKHEVPKIAKLAPKRYVLVTSKPLSPSEKDTLVGTLSPFCRGPEDVLGAEDLNALLRKYPDAEKAHFKLWIASTAVLQAVLHNDLFSRSYLETEEIKTRLSLFVSTGAMNRATNALESRGFCLLSGIPGIGKTTTAEMLVALMLDQGWECICISSNAAEGLRAYQQDRRQVFYYDDFLGKTNLTEKLGKNEDRDLIRLVRTCSKRPKQKRLILTTRNYLLSQAFEQHELLRRTDFDAATCVVELHDYTPPVRAQILVNHLWFYGVREDWCRKLVECGSARTIVDHPNYNPRLIEAICERAPAKRHTAASFANQSLNLLNNPADLWRHAYENQLSVTARELLVCFASLGNKCYLEALQTSYREFTSQSEDDLHSEDRFHRALRELEGTFVQVEHSGKNRTVAYHNPSVKDFMDGVFETTPSCAIRVLNTAKYYNQVGYAARYALRPKQRKEAEVLICAALRKHLLRESAVPELLFGEPIGVTPIQPAQRLIGWRNAYHKGVNDVIKAEICKLSIDYLNSGNYYEDKAKDVAELIRLSASDAAVVNAGTKLDIDTVKRWLWANLKSLDDYVSMKWWVEDWDENEAKMNAYQKLRDVFLRKTSSILDDLADGDHSSSDIQEGINEILDAAEQLGVEADEFDMDAAESAREIIEEAEEREADMREDEWRMRRLEELSEKRQVDDILDSLR